jgi:hypothetical protein
MCQGTHFSEFLPGKPFRGDDGVSVVTLWPTLYQKIRTVEEVEKARREEMKQLASSLVWDIRNAAAQDGKLDSALAQRLDAIEQKLLADHCQQEPDYYNDNLRYKSQFQQLLREAATAREQVLDSTSFLSRSLAQQQQQAQAQASVQDGSNLYAPPAVPSHHVSGSTSEVSALHSKFTQDPNFKGVLGKFGADELFAAGIDCIVGPLDVQYIHAMYNEHCLVSGASQSFTTFEGLMETTPEREWLFVVGHQEKVLHVDMGFFPMLTWEKVNMHVESCNMHVDVLF